jgi:5-methylthioribose kinase
LFPLTEESAPAYLRQAGWPEQPVSSIRPLGGGVSNTVLLADGPGGRFVLKQALEKLRVEADWRSRPDRTLREADALQSMAAILPPGAVPHVLFIDRPNCIYAMEAAPAGSPDWKTELLAGRIDPRVAAAAGRTLGAMIRTTWRQPDWQQRFGDQTVFDELRLDPYYRFTAARHPAFAAHFARLISSCAERRVSLVHGDWSPKNLLVTPGGVMAIDFEVVHYGDPCFDTGFLLCHLLLKSIHMPPRQASLLACAEAFWQALDFREPWAFDGTVAHLAGLLLARADGKSPAEYLSPGGKESARRLAAALIDSPATSIEKIWQCL